MDKVLIFGVTGFTGKALLRYITKERLDESFSFAGTGRGECPEGPVAYIQADLLQQGSVEEIIRAEQPDYIMNLAGTFQGGDFDAMLAVNANITRRICDSITRNALPVKKVLVIGSAAEYGYAEHFPITEEEPLKPVNYYGLTKLIQTQYALYYHANHRIDINVARTFNILGRNMPEALSVGTFVKQIREAGDNGTIFTGNLQSKRDFLDVDDVVNAYWRILVSGISGRIYNVCRGRSHAVSEVLDHLIRESGKRLTISVRKDRMKARDIPDSYGDNSRLKADTGWDGKIDLLDSLSRMVH